MDSDKRKPIMCPSCGVDARESGMVVTERVSKLYLREPYADRLVVAGTLGIPEIDGVQCRSCQGALRVTFLECLEVQG